MQYCSLFVLPLHYLSMQLLLNNLMLHTYAVTTCAPITGQNKRPRTTMIEVLF